MRNVNVCTIGHCECVNSDRFLSACTHSTQNKITRVTQDWGDLGGGEGGRRELAIMQIRWKWCDLNIFK